MTPEEYQRLLDLVRNAAPGSVLEAAKRAGFNPRFTVYLLLFDANAASTEDGAYIRFKQPEKTFIRGKRTRPRYAQANAKS